MLNLVIFGPPGSGKGTQSDLLIKEYGLHHISTGELLRKHIAEGSELGKIADSYCSVGQLIPDELMVDILEHELDAHPEMLNGLILDGFPRTIAQARKLKALMSKFDKKIDAVVGLELPDDLLTDRMIRRGQLEGRTDDNLETIKKRIEVYHSKTHPLRQYYIDEGKYVPVKADGTIDEVFNNLKSSLDSFKQE